MTETDVGEVARLLKNRGIEFWVDGGWGVDALLGAQTRVHSDIDIVIPEGDVGPLATTLEIAGYKRVEGGRPFNFVLSGGRDRQVDVHVVVFDSAGNGLYGPQADDGTGMRYPASAFGGEGTIYGESVRCMTAEYQMTNHSGREPRKTDLHDIQALHARFGLPLPADLR
jgi:lincosamide nucleotidyltransferase A/C/D/E